MSSKMTTIDEIRSRYNIRELSPGIYLAEHDDVDTERDLAFLVSSLDAERDRADGAETLLRDLERRYDEVTRVAHDVNSAEFCGDLPAKTYFNMWRALLTKIGELRDEVERLIKERDEARSWLQNACDRYDALAGVDGPWSAIVSERDAIRAAAERVVEAWFTSEPWESARTKVLYAMDALRDALRGGQGEEVRDGKA